MIKNFPFFKFFSTCGVLILLFSSTALAEKATVHIIIKNFTGSIGLNDPKSQYDITKDKVTVLKFNNNQPVSYSINIDRPSYLILYFVSSNFFNCSLFLSPGDEIFLTADFSKKTPKIVVTGRGSNNNQPEIFALTNMDTQPFKGDVLPNRIITAINQKYFMNKIMLENYIKENKPSRAFIKTALMNQQYFVPSTYYEFNHDNNFGKSPEKLRKWQQVQDSIFSTVKLSNDGALTAYNYTNLIDNFIIREKEQLGMQFTSNPSLFFKQWYHCSLADGKRLFKDKPPGILNVKIIDNYFTRNVAEYAYSQSLKNAVHKADYTSTVLIFDHFKNKYPTSDYVKAFNVPMTEIINKQTQVLSRKAIFIKDNGTKLNTLEDVLALTKGKVVFIDMWGTWCGPCREEIEKNAARLKAQFSGRDIVFLYIANFDIGKEKEWKKQIAYFQIEGVHILANAKLTKDIMEKVKGGGYPTYIIVKKDGSYMQTATKYPINLKVMMKEIETAAK